MPQLKEWKEFAKTLFQELDYREGATEAVEDILLGKLGTSYFSKLWERLKMRQALSQRDYRILIGLIDELHYDVQEQSYEHTELRDELLQHLRRGSKRRIAIYRSLLGNCSDFSSATLRDEIISLVGGEQHYLDNWDDYPLDGLIEHSYSGYLGVIEVLEKLEKEKATLNYSS
jgi:hypothetical protein